MHRLLFVAAIFAGSFLLFWVQPLLGRFLLPVLGGAPAVWNTAMVLFQILLLAGYGWAHLGVSHLRLARPGWALAHVILAAGAWWVIAIARPAPADLAPALWVALVIVLQVGLPFAVLAAGGPLLQRWYAAAGTRRDPYVLFAASNAGSLLALLAYPLLFEPLWDLPTQAAAWRWSYAGYAVLLGACALCVRRSSPVDGRRAAEDGGRATGDGRPPLGRRLRWLGLAAVPSGFLLAVTGRITTDVAAVPLLWVVPLAIYLGTFLVAFAGRHPPGQEGLRRLLPHAVAVLVLFSVLGLQSQLWFDLPLQLGGLALVGLACHGELARSRPPAENLTGFYLWLSLGGVLGGCFAGVAAPVIFATHLEYPLLLILGLGLLAGDARPERRTVRLLALALPLAGLAFGLALADRARLLPWLKLGILVMAAAVGGLVLRWPRRPGRVLLLATAIFAALHLVAPAHRALLAKRNFFGTQRVVRRGDFLLFFHGTTCHGAQELGEDGGRNPLTYFHRDGPLGRLFAAYGDRPARRVAVLGLGVGTIAAYGRPGDRFAFFEIDPAVVATARDDRFFTYLRDSEAEVAVRVGDGRLLLEAEADAAYDLVIQDAFSSDAVPVHLVTREALATYLAKLKPGGLLVYNLSSRYFTFEPLLDRQFRDAGLHARIRYDVDRSREEKRRQILPSIWAVAARHPADLAPLAGDPAWRPLRGGDGVRPWTDGYANILGILGSPEE